MRILPVLLLFLFPCLMSCQQAQDYFVLDFSSISATEQGTEKSISGADNIVFQSTDRGQTWQDISAGLPQDFDPAAFLADKEELLRLNGTGIWMPIFTDLEGRSVRTVFTARDGSVFIGSDNGLFKSADQGKTWTHVMQDGWVIRMAESDGVLLCTNERGILRSADGGVHWDVVLSEGGVGIAVEAVKGGFAAITYNAASKTRRIRISTDGGKTWQPIDAGLPPSALISSIKQVGDSFFCGHPKGVYRSDDLGKTWNLLLPTIGEKVFNLSVSGEVMYAILMDGGC